MRIDIKRLLPIGTTNLKMSDSVPTGTMSEVSKIRFFPLIS